MRKVWKYPIDVGVNDIEMPRNPQFLHVGEQNGQLMLWCLVDPHAEVCRYRIDVVGTGSEAPTQTTGLYIGTEQVGPFVWHVFWRRF